MTATVLSTDGAGESVFSLEVLEMEEGAGDCVVVVESLDFDLVLTLPLVLIPDDAGCDCLRGDPVRGTFFDILENGVGFVLDFFVSALF